MSPVAVDHYAVLGVKETASPDEIRRAYRERSLVLHPDRPTGDADRFAALAASYAVLSDEVARGRYDVERRLAARRSAPPDPPSTPDPPAPPGPPAGPPVGLRDERWDPPPPPPPPSKRWRIWHRSVSYAVAAFAGALWWPAQLALAHLFPAPPHSGLGDLQSFVERPGAEILIPTLAGAAIYAERRLAPVHRVRAALDVRLRPLVLAALGAVLAGPYVTRPLVAVVVLALAAGPYAAPYARRRWSAITRPHG